MLHISLLFAYFQLNNHFRDSIDFQTNSTQKLVAYSQLQKAGFLVEGGNVNHHTEEKVAQGTVQEGNGRSLNSMANVRNQLYWQQVAGIDVLKLSHYNNINSMAESSKRQNTQRRRQPHQLYKCEVCGSEFVHRTHLKIHQRTHTGEKPYKCEFCGKCFAQKGNLHVHMKTHTGIKEFVCDFCHRAFVTNAQLVVHVRTHINPNNRKKNNVSSTFNKNNLPTNSNKQPESENDQLNTSFNPVMTQYEVSTNSKYISSKSGSMQVDTVGGKLKSQPSELTNLEGLVLNPAEIDQHRGHKVSSVGNLQNLQQQQHTIVKSQLGINDNIQNNLVLTQDNSLYDLQTSVRPPL